MKISQTLSVLFLSLSLVGCGGSTVFSPPVSPDGREVKIVVSGEPDGDLALIFGSLIGWDSEWITLKKSDGEISHFSTDLLMSVHEL
jgi:hypothetical protein